MSTPKNASSLRKRGLLLLGGAFLMALPVLGTASCVGTEDPTENGSADDERVSTSDEEALSAVTKLPHKAVCADAGPGFAHCHARIRTDATGNIVPLVTPSGLTPANIQAAYAIPAAPAGLTVAIVDAYDDPKAESDLAVYRSQFGLPACTTANGCFKKVSQTGSTTALPTADNGWAGEIALDVDMVSAACPNCKILLVEAKSASMADLGAAVNRAALLGATVISNSYGGGEDTSSVSDDSTYFNHPGIAITVSSGDDGYGVEFPASSSHVIAVGGTSLTKSTTLARGWSEGAWGSAGSGCSAKIAKPSFQTDTACAKRTVADVSAVADPNTGVAVYNTQGGSAAGATGWAVYGGTSASSPIVASILAATGKGSVDNSWPYAHKGAFYDVTSGHNGTTCGGNYLCTSLAGYDGPTGLGTPNGAIVAAGGGTTTSTTSAATTGGGSTCSHAVCTTGTKLTSTCSSCASAVCAADSYCCNTSWDSTCVSEVPTYCGSCN
jgi:hypothetical protein